MSVRLNYSDGSPLAYIPASAVDVIRRKHQAINPACFCNICHPNNTDKTTSRRSLHQAKTNETTKKSRKRKLERDELFEDDDEIDYDEPQPKRQRISSREEDADDEQWEDDEVDAYAMSELNGLSVKELKELLRKQNFPVSGKKTKLIDRLLYPEQTIREMKYSHWKKKPKGVRVQKGTSQRKVNQLFEKFHQFNPDKFVFKNGKIKKVPLYLF